MDFKEAKEAVAKVSSVFDRRALIAVIQAVKFELEQDLAELGIELENKHPSITFDIDKQIIHINYSTLWLDTGALTDHPLATVDSYSVDVRLISELKFRDITIRATIPLYSRHSEEDKELLEALGKLQYTYKSLVC